MVGNQHPSQDTEKYPIVHCKECGEDHQAYYMDDVRDNMVAQQLCFSCLFWQEYVDRKDEPEIARINGEHYFVQPLSPAAGGMRGYGGHPFTIHFTDGRPQPIVHTINLWHQGVIPAHFRDRLPDNATWWNESGL